jgi:hypothetical protein
MNQLFDMSSDEVINDFVEHVPRKRRRYQEKKNHLDYWQWDDQEFYNRF